MQGGLKSRELNSHLNNEDIMLKNENVELSNFKLRASIGQL